MHMHTHTHTQVDDLGVNLNSSELETVISYLSHVDETNEHGAVIDTNAFGQLAAVAAVAAMKSTGTQRCVLYILSVSLWIFHS
jgi:acyl-CoA hydrolase